MAKERKPSLSGGTPAVQSSTSMGIAMERELIVIAKPEAALRSTREGVASRVGTDVGPLTKLLDKEGVSLRPLFGVTEERLQFEAATMASSVGAEVPDLSVYYHVQAPDERLDALAEQLRQQELVETAYVKPKGEPPQLLNDMTPFLKEAPPASPDFSVRQGYLNPAPGGIDARYAWTLGGGGGANIRIIDLEWGWRFSHEDLLQNQGGIVGGVGSPDDNHGTAVLGEISGDRNPCGITGIAPDANISAVAFSMPTAAAIRLAADRLNPGDIILLEIHRPGPRATGAGQFGFIAIEWWPDDFDAIKYATSKGVIVVEAAGNGFQNLDDPIYSQRHANFPASWTNPFNRANRDSGAIIIGAGAPPPGTHGRDHGPDRSRLDFSNYGACVDAQGWGREVTSTGYGDLQGGSNRDLWYTDQFSGTSSASPIVVGAMACIQGVLKNLGRTPLNPGQARDLLRRTGSPQQDAPGRPASQRIGNRPNLRAAIAEATKVIKIKDKDFKEKEVKEKDRKDVKDIKDHKEKDRKEFKEKERKEGKEVKEVKESKEKDTKDIKDIREKGIREKGLREISPAVPEPEVSLEERVASLEAAMIQLGHFIGAELRPELTESSLANEADLLALSRELDKEAKDAKQAKDIKDVEKLNET